jgi:hypothetical protein
MPEKCIKADCDEPKLEGSNYCETHLTAKVNEQATQRGRHEQQQQQQQQELQRQRQQE